jgi:plastocyanin
MTPVPRGALAALALLTAFTFAALLPLPTAEGHGLSYDVAPGGNFTWPFVAPGSVDYHCHRHPGMMGSIMVLDGPTNRTSETHVVRIVEPTTDPASWGFEPASLEIVAGDFVRWVNEGRQIHDVTEDSAHTHGDGAQHTGHDHNDAPLGGVLGLLAVMFAALAVARRRYT